MIERLVALLKTYKTHLEFEHWNAKSYEKHLLFDRLKNEIDDILDRAVEVSLGKRASFLDYFEYSTENTMLQKEFSDVNAKDLALYIRQELADYNLDSDEENVVIDIIEMLDKHLYLMK